MTHTTNIEESKRFLVALGCDGNTRFRTFADSSKVNNPPLCLDPDAFPDVLIKKNNKGCGVFVVVNATTGDRDQDVTRVRAVFVDLDGAPLEPVTDCGLNPHIIVESSPDRFHAYWMVTQCPLEKFKSIQQAVAGRFNGDKAVVNLSRVMRVPGFIHQKGKPFKTRIVSISDHAPYTVQQIVDGLQLSGFFQHEQHKTKQREQSTGNRPGDDYNRRVSWADVLAPHGWTLKHTTSDGREMWNKPGHIGQQSATVNHAGSDLLYCFSDSAGLPANEGLSKYAVYTYLQHGGDFSAATKELARLGYGQTSKNSAGSANRNEGIAEGEAESVSLFISPDEMFCDDSIEPEYLIDGMMECDTIGQTFGASGSGKSFVVIDKGLSIATGGTWNGKQCKRGVVLYLAGEGYKGIKRRVKAWRDHYGMSVTDILNFRLSRQCIDFEASNIQAVINEGKSLEQKLGEPIMYIVIDTLARHLIGDENKTSDMNTFIKAKDLLRTSFPGSVVESVHHTGLAADSKGRSRGSSAGKGAYDFEIFCCPGILDFTKMKESELPPPIEFKLVPIQIGTKKNGESITSCIVEYGESSASQKTATLTPLEKIALNALVTTCIAENNLEHGQYAASLEGWRQEFYRVRRIEDDTLTADTLKKSFQLVTGTATRGGGLKEKCFVGFIENRGAIPLRLSDQDQILSAILHNGKREQDGNTTGTVPVSGKRETGTHHIQGVPVFPSDIPPFYNGIERVEVDA